jgi:glycosyltransferase involved in cell wall biosynthesis
MSQKLNWQKLSVVIPVYNEAGNVQPLYEALITTLRGVDRDYEILFVDDGSIDGTQDLIRELAEKDSRVKVICFRKNYGQTAALSAGFRHASGDIIIAMDGDLQNDPVDIPRLLNKIDEGFDVVSGRRKKRHDPFFSRKIPSFLANKIISWVSGVSLEDYGCTLKAYRASFVKNIRLFGEMHRFIPIYAYNMGARLTEIPVTHHPRRHGKSKYTPLRTFKVLLDLVTVKFLGTFSTKPIYMFGGLGIFCIFLGVLATLITLIQKFVYGSWVHRNPMISIAIFFLLVGFQFVLMGLLAEITIRIYHESQDHPTYWIRETVNLKSEPCVESRDM